MLEIIAMSSAGKGRYPAGSEQKGFPSQFSPMLLHAEKKPFSREGWVFEPKLDGMRALALINNGNCRLLSRNGRDITLTFPGLAKELAKHRGQLILDGEIVVCDEHGKPDFERLQGRWLLTKTREVEIAEARTPASLYVFDMLHHNGFDLTGCQLLDRKHVLHKRVSSSRDVHLVQHFDDGLALYDACKEQKLEGIVCKRASSLYRSGARSKDWIKVKFTQLGTFVVVGYRKDDGFLVADVAGSQLRVVGTVQYGFSQAAYKELLSRLRPAADREISRGKRQDNLVWFEPSVWIDVEFMQWTQKGLLRFPVFKDISGAKALACSTT